MKTPAASGVRAWTELGLIFLRLGLTAFGGPAAHLAMMEREFVRLLGWVTHEEFLDMLGTVNLIPGPSSTEMAIFIGYRRAGRMGLLLGGVCFILPAMLLVMLIAWMYVRYGSLPQVGRVLDWIKPVILAIIVQALWGLGQKALKTRFLAFLGVAATGFCLLGCNQLLVLFGAGFLAVLARWKPRLAKPPGASPGARGATPIALLAAGIGVPAIAKAAPFGLWPLFLFFLKTGSVLFGSGYVLLAFLRTDLVERWHWLDAGKLLDAVAVGQITPGPVFTTATFIGYLLAGTKGALVATIGIFLPSFFLVAAAGPVVPRLRKWPPAAAFLDGVNASSLGLMAAVAWQLGASALPSLAAYLTAAVSTFLLLRTRINPSWLVLAAALAGLFSALFRG